MHAEYNLYTKHDKKREELSQSYFGEGHHTEDRRLSFDNVIESEINLASFNGLISISSDNSNDHINQKDEDDTIEMHLRSFKHGLGLIDSNDTDNSAEALAGAIIDENNN